MTHKLLNYIKLKFYTFNRKRKLKKSLFEFKKLNEISDRGFCLDIEEAMFFSNDNTNNTIFDTHYIYHTAWAARILKKINPIEHIDISSSLYFCSISSAFLPIKFYDYRPANLKLSNLQTGKADLLYLPFTDNSIASLSCMHTIEHVGLGRYGDPLDYNGDLKAIHELIRVLAINGNLLLVVPIGKPKIIFNAHRIYSYEQLIKTYFKEFQLIEFSLIPDNAIETGILTNATEEISNQQNYGCGCFWFKKVK